MKRRLAQIEIAPGTPLSQGRLPDNNKVVEDDGTIHVEMDQVTLQIALITCDPDTFWDLDLSRMPAIIDGMEQAAEAEDE